MAPRRSARLKAAAAATATAVPASPPKATVTKKKVTKRKTTATTKTNVGPKKRRTGMSSAPNTSKVLGVVDPESKILNGTIEVLDNEGCDCMLVLIDPSKNMDKFFILQLIKCPTNFVVYSRWGRTGTSGQGIVDPFDKHVDAVNAFEKKFKEKTGLKWENRGDATIDGKYRVIQQNFVEKQSGYTSAKWQYWVDDGIDGKSTGWYDYDKSGSRNVEQLFQENLSNSRLTSRLVDSGCWTYEVDLSNMTQTNVKHPNRTSRHIRRHTGKGMDETAPPPTVTMVGLKTSLPPINTGAPSLVTPTTSPTSSVQTASPSSTTSSAVPQQKTAKPPVDTDVPSHSNYSVVKNANDQWYDVVLNQCNITGGSNNNKYYRIQLLDFNSTGKYYVWFKWGRVGEPPVGTQLHGPYSTEDAAMKVFAKKYRDKTKNKWGDDKFVPVKGKYTRIEIDYEVEVKSEFKASGGDDVEFEYLESTLDPKTKELIEELFSKETRDNALTSFNLDLKKLPLGVPSQQQINNGVAILNQIEDKLNGGGVSDSYDELSSKFYTAIPHSFGRRRPPRIADQVSLQGRYDMCNILLDMYSTNEVIQQLEAQKKKAKKKQIPYPADSHYATLKADLSLVDTKSDEYKHIENYFNETKSSGSRAQMLNVWAVDRNGEAERHKKFDKLDNRRLLWHGTNVAVVAPIITSGLRIMPHSGGRVGAGIYLASMQEKSAQYTSAYGAKFACMFLCEGALGKSHTVTSDGYHASSLKKAPAGFDSVHAVGSITPKSWTKTEIDKKSIDIPSSKAHSSGVSSSFHHDEFLIYDEAQVRLRYVITVKL